MMEGTPKWLKKAGLFKQIAISLKGGPWREASMALLAIALGLSKEESEDAALGVALDAAVTDRVGATLDLVTLATLPRLPPTHIEYLFVDSLAFGVRGLDIRRLAMTNI